VSVSKLSGLRHVNLDVYNNNNNNNNNAPVRTLHSSNANLLTAHPNVKHAMASRAFRVASPKLWNSLHHLLNLAVHKCRLKSRIDFYLVLPSHS